MSTSKKDRARSWLKNIGLLLLSFLVAGLLMEGMLVVLGKQFDASIYTGDRDTGWSLRANAEGWHVQEGSDYVRINGDGLRDREHSLDKPEDTLRIAVVGDSFSAALELPMEKAFWSVLEKRLGDCDGVRPKKIEVINFGVGGYGQGHELMMMRSRVWKYHPDIVLLQMYLGNDIFNNSRKMNRVTDSTAPFFYYESDALVLDESYRSAPNLQPGAIGRANLFNDFLNHSRLLLMLSSVPTLLQKGDAVPSKGGVRTKVDPGPREQVMYLPPKTPELEDAWRVTEGLLSIMDKESKEHGADLWVTTLSTPVQVYPDAEARAELTAKLGAPDLFYPDYRVRDFGAKSGIHVMTLAPEMASYADANKVFLHGYSNQIIGEGHWNEDGHRVGGELMAEKLCKALGASEEAAP